MCGTMPVKTLEEMNEIVSKSKTLEWDGWDVISLTKDEYGEFVQEGVRRNGEWYILRRFPLTDEGWNIPGRLL